MFNRVNEETLWSFLQWVSWQRRPDYQPCYARIGGPVGGGLTRQRKPEREAFLAVFSPKHCASTRLAIKKALMLCIKAFPCSGGRTRTYDLRVMSPTSYQLLHSALLWDKCKRISRLKPNYIDTILITLNQLKNRVLGVFRGKSF